jgi:hypothetical protein
MRHPPAYDLREICKDHMVEVAQRTGDTPGLQMFKNAVAHAAKTRTVTGGRR